MGIMGGNGNDDQLSFYPSHLNQGGSQNNLTREAAPLQDAPLQTSKEKEASRFQAEEASRLQAEEASRFQAEEASRFQAEEASRLQAEEASRLQAEKEKEAARLQ